MKMPQLTPGARQGNVIILTVVMTGIVGFTLASYLDLLRAQNMAVTRSQAWNTAMPVIEAGIEDALAHLNKNGTNRLDIDGWTREGDMYWIRRSIGSSFYVATITNWFSALSLLPIVESRAYVETPVQVVSRSRFEGMLANITGGTPIPQGFLARGVRAPTRRAALFAKGMVADGQIDLNGQDVDADSFDSTDPLHSNNGLYDPTKNKDNGSVASNSGLTNSVNVGNANIMGKVSTGPGGSVYIGPNGAIGSKAFHDANKKGIEDGWVDDDMNVDFPDVVAPSIAGAVMPGPGIIGGTTYGYVLGDGTYYLNSIYATGESGSIYVSGHATLIVNGNIQMTGTSSIEIGPGGSLALYAKGYSTSLSGNGVINKTGMASNFVYYGTPSNQQLSLVGNGEFVGVIYAPQANFYLRGSGREYTDFIGASITKSARLDGHYKFHYDEALANMGPSRAYVITEWNEMTPDQVTSLDVSGLLQNYYDTLGGGSTIPPLQ